MFEPVINKKTFFHFTPTFVVYKKNYLVKIGRKIQRIGTFPIKFTILIFLYVHPREKF